MHRICRLLGLVFFSQIFQRLFEHFIRCFLRLLTSVTMVFFCEAAQCWAHDSKRKNPEKWGWMKAVTWVKFPTEAGTRATWLRLIRRKDKVNLTKKSRLCSRHFDKEQIDPDGYAKGYPKYFFWNNFGLIGEHRR